MHLWGWGACCTQTGLFIRLPRVGNVAVGIGRSRDLLFCSISGTQLKSLRNCPVNISIYNPKKDCILIVAYFLGFRTIHFGVRKPVVFKLTWEQKLFLFLIRLLKSTDKNLGQEFDIDGVVTSE